MFKHLLCRLIDGPSPPKAFADMDHWERHSFFYEHALRLRDASDGVVYFTGAAVAALFSGHLPTEVAKVMDESPFDARPWVVSCYLKHMSERCFEAAEQEVIALRAELRIAA